MNTLLHNFKKDFRRFLLPLALWVVSFVILTWVRSFHPQSLAPELSALMPIAMFSLTVLYLLTTVVLVAGVILEDPPQGTTAFWLTRPLPRKSIAAEKLGFLAMVILIPLVIELLLMAFAGAGPRVLLLAAVSKALIRTPLVLALAAFAILAETYGQFVIKAILILLGTGIVAAIVASLIQHRLHGTTHLGGAEGGPTLGAARLMVFQMLVSLLGSGIVAWRYLCRHARWAAAAVAVASLIAMLAPLYWPWDFLALKPAATAAVEATPVPLTLENIQTQSRGAAALTGSITIPSDSDGNVAMPRSVSAIKLTWADGGNSFIPGFQNLRLQSVVAYAPASLAKALAPINVLNLPRKLAGQFDLMVPDRALRDRLLYEPARLDAIVTVALWRFEVAGQLSLKPGSQVSLGLRKLEVAATSSSDSGEGITLREGLYPSVLTNALDQSGTTVRFGGESWINTFVQVDDAGFLYLLVNRNRSEAVLASRITNANEENHSGYVLADLNLQFANAALDASWMDGATLLFVRIASSGQTTAALRVANVNAER